MADYDNESQQVAEYDDPFLLNYIYFLSIKRGIAYYKSQNEYSTFEADNGFKTPLILEKLPESISKEYMSMLHDALSLRSFDEYKDKLSKWREKTSDKIDEDILSKWEVRDTVHVSYLQTQKYKLAYDTDPGGCSNFKDNYRNIELCLQSQHKRHIYSKNCYVCKCQLLKNMATKMRLSGALSTGNIPLVRKFEAQLFQNRASVQSNERQQKNTETIQETTTKTETRETTKQKREKQQELKRQLKR